MDDGAVEDARTEAGDSGSDASVPRIDECAGGTVLERVVAPFAPSDGQAITRIALDGHQLFFSTQHVLYGVREPGAQPEELWALQTTRMGLIRHQDKLLVPSPVGLATLVPRGSIERVLNLAMPAFEASAFPDFIDGTYAYYQRGGTSPSLGHTGEWDYEYYSADLENGVRTLLGSNRGRLSRPVLAGAYIYVANRAPEVGDLCPGPACASFELTASVLQRLPASGGPVDDVEVDFGSQAPFAFIPIGSDEQELLLAALPLEGAENDRRQGLYRVPLEGGAATQLIQADPRAGDALRVGHTSHAGRSWVHFVGPQELYEIGPGAAPQVRRLCDWDGTLSSVAADATGLYLGLFDEAERSVSIQRFASDDSQPGGAAIDYGECLLRGDLPEIMAPDREPLDAEASNCSLSGYVGASAYFLCRTRFVPTEDGDGPVTQKILKRAPNGERTILWQRAHREDDRVNVLGVLPRASDLLVSLEDQFAQDGIFALAPDGSSFTRLAERPFAFRLVTVDGDKLYYIEDAAFHVLDLSNGISSPLTEAVPELRMFPGVALFKAGAWLVVENNLGALYRAPIAGGTPERIDLSLQDGLWVVDVIASEPDALLVTVRDIGPRRLLVYRVPVADGSATRILEFDRWPITGAQIPGATLIQVTDDDLARPVYRLAHGGLQAEPLFCFSGGPIQLVVDDGVYAHSGWWTSKLPD